MDLLLVMSINPLKSMTKVRFLGVTAGCSVCAQLTESLIKNCGYTLHSALASSKDIVNSLGTIAEGKKVCLKS